MKKIFFLMATFGLLVSACGSAAKPAAPSEAAINPSPVAPVDLNATAAIMVQQTIAAMPTQTALPSVTPVVVTETPSATPTLTVPPTLPVTATETPNPILLTLTATLGTGTPGSPILASTTQTVDLGSQTETPYPRTYGTMPPQPHFPSGKLYLANKANSEVTISLHCTTKDGNVTIIEYPVVGTIQVNAPSGKYHFVVWVGGKKYTGDFRLDGGGEIGVTIYKNHVEIN